MTETPSIFDSSGRFTPLPESVLDNLPREVVAAHQLVQAAAQREIEIEHEVAAKTRVLHTAIEELREIETVLARHAPTHTDLVRELISSSRHGVQQQQ